MNSTASAGSLGSDAIAGSKLVLALEWIQANTSFWSVMLTLIIGIVVYDQVNYLIKKGSIVGPTFKIWPIMGPFLESVDPKFEEYYNKWMSGPLSCVSVFHKFVVIASTRDLARKILTSPAYVKPCVVDVAIKILRPTNWVFLDGKAHLDYRKGLNNLFTRKSLGIYLPHQENIYDQYFDRFVNVSKNGPIPFMHEFREINCAVSLRTFCGTYITEDQVRIIADNYYKITAALELVNFPIVLPFTKTWYGKKCADMTMDIFAKCAAMSKKAMAEKKEVTCTMDAWIKAMNDSRDEAEANGTKRSIREFTNKEISETIFTFLFASQDASSSATTWLFQLVADNPDVLEKIRAEQLAVRGGDPTKRITLDMVDEMHYTNMVVKECLRLRPPVLMVPYVAKKDYPISEDYTVPKGAMVIPTLYPSLHDPEVYDQPEEFIPERWEEGTTASKGHKNWLVFGTGPHVCLGQKYAVMHFMTMIGKASLELEWSHTITDLSEKIKVFATIFPQDDCILQFKRRDLHAVAA
ncbi:cytochrome P450 [Nadsonia fulvescens var. elongata DSM 6958]|uniref:C-22 sterol desaturase ERG5 n=1 Tax=Nadsonia fulvescens var. elongata DSM 6958 TaxID=857566 RepID=A0A1E3PRR2_9ASCO|nr:cytochrome P450 [Nadsonia fulvescens var. elongata DSM 6958]